MRIFKSRYQCKHYKKIANRQIQYIVIHYTGNVAKAEAQAKYYSRSQRVVSAHYIVTDHLVWEVLDPSLVAFHVTGARACRNETSLGVDLETLKKDETSCKASDLDWYHSPGVLQTAAELVAFLMAQFNVPLHHVVRHYDVTGKACPASMVGKKARFNGLSGDDEWARFKGMIEAELDRGLSGLAAYEAQ